MCRSLPMARTTTSPALSPTRICTGTPWRAPHLRGILLHGGLHGQRRIAGPHRMVLMRQGRPKQRHDAIAHDLVDRAFVAVHGGHHAFQHGIEELPRLFRIAVGQQLHGAFEVGKQHRDLLALAFQGTAGGENLLREIGWGVGEGACGRRCGAAGAGSAASPVQTRIRRPHPAATWCASMSSSLRASRASSSS